MAIAPGFGADTLVDAFTGWEPIGTSNNDQADWVQAQNSVGDNLAEVSMNDRNEATVSYVATTAAPTIPTVGQVTTTGGFIVVGVSCEGNHDAVATMQLTLIKWDDNMDTVDNLFAPLANSAAFPCGTSGFGLTGSMIGLAAGTAGGDVQSISYSLGVDTPTAADKVGDHLAVELINAREEVSENWIGEVNQAGLTANYNVDSTEVTTSHTEHDTTTVTTHRYIART